MPVKVRCPGCEQAFNVPDKARGKSITCPKCSEKIKVPAGDGAPAAGSAPPTKPAAKPKPKKADDRFLGGLDDYGIEDQEQQICPYCAAPLEEEDEICPGCGRDLSTGQMDKKEARKRSKEGKSTAYFYKNFLRESWEFVIENKSLAFRTGGILTFFMVLYMACFFMQLYCEKLPPRIFWIVMMIVTGVGGPGWIWFLTRKLVAADLYNEKVDPDRIHYDFFTNVALGLAACIWPYVVSWPLILPAIIASIAMTILSGGRPEVAGVMIGAAAGALTLLPMIAFPIATVHMVAKHQHKAWIAWDLLKLVFKNIGPIFVYHSISFVIGLIFGGTAIAAAVFGGDLHLFNNPRISQWSASITTWFYGMIGSPTEAGTFMFVIVQMPLMFLFAFLFVCPFMMLLAFPLVFQMKVNGLIAKHFTHSLDLDQRIYPLTPAGFWVRFLAYQTDSMLFPLASFIVTHDKRFVLLGQVLNGIIMLVGFTQGWDSVMFTYTVLPLVLAYNKWMYFAGSHSGPNKATLGMEAFGLICIPDGEKVKQKDLDRPIPLGKASLRWFCVEISEKLLGLPFVSCAFHPEKKAIHDLISKTRIVFEGDK